MVCPGFREIVKVAGAPVVLFLMIGVGSDWAWDKPYFFVPAFLILHTLWQRWRALVGDATRMG